MHLISDVLRGEHDRDGAESNIALEEPIFDPRRLGHVGIHTYRDDNNDQDEESSESSLDRYYYNSF